jgi:predicted nucleic acid-binding protein
MPDSKQIVINTSPLLALSAALGDLSLLQSLYTEVFVPFEVCQEIEKGGLSGFSVAEFKAAHFLHKLDKPLIISPFLKNSLDIGEASVIQLALDKGIQTVCIDETVGRRIARLNNLTLTGSIGILIRAHREGYLFSMPEAIKNMQARGIWLSDNVISIALKEVEKNNYLH